jgi:hypothetical protein
VGHGQPSEPDGQTTTLEEVSALRLTRMTSDAISAKNHSPEMGSFRTRAFPRLGDQLEGPRVR